MGLTHHLLGAFLIITCALASPWPRPAACGIEPNGPLPNITISPPANSTLVQVVMVTRHGDRVLGSYSMQDASSVMIERLASSSPPTTCWMNDEAVYDCSLTVTEIPSTNYVSTEVVPRLYRKSMMKIVCFVC